MAFNTTGHKKAMLGVKFHTHTPPVLAFHCWPSEHHPHFMYCTKINSQNKKNKKKLAGLKVTNAGGGEKLIEFKFSSCLPRPFFIRGCDELSPDKTKSVD